MFSTKLTEIYIDRHTKLGLFRKLHDGLTEIYIDRHTKLGLFRKLHDGLIGFQIEVDCKYGDKTLVGNFCYIEMRSILLKYFFITKVLAPKSSVM